MQGSGAVALVRLVEDLYDHREEHFKKIYEFLGTLFAKMQGCLDQVWTEVKKVATRLLFTAGGIAKQVFTALWDIMYESAKLSITEALNKSWSDWWGDISGAILKVLWPWSDIGMQFDNIVAGTTEAIQQFSKLTLRTAGELLDKVLGGVVGIIDDLGLYIQVLTWALPTILGTIIPGAGNSIGATIGQWINTITAFIVRAIGIALDVIKVVTGVDDIYDLFKGKIDDAQAEEASGEEEVEENPPDDLPYIVFTDDEAKRLAQDVLKIVSVVTPTLIKLVMSILGTAAAAIAKTIGDKLFAWGGETWQKILDFIDNKCVKCLFTCLAAGTPVQAEFGPKPIEDVCEGERVWSRDPATGEWRLAAVTERFHHLHVGPLVTVRVGSEDVVATPGHPFWVVRGEGLDERPASVEGEETDGGACSVVGRWVDAVDLRAGDELACLGDENVVVESVRVADAARTVYNFHVTGLQSYAASAAGLWVHNKKSAKASNCPHNKKAPVQQKPNWKQSKPSSKKLSKNLGIKPKSGIDAHHIVAGKKPKAAPARKILNKYQIDINSAENGVGLVGGKGAPKNVKPRHHRGSDLHSDRTLNGVNKRLRDVTKGIEDWGTARQAVIDEIAQIRKEIRKGKFP